MTTTSILLMEADGGWVAHLLDHDLVGQGRTMAGAVRSVRAAYEVSVKRELLANLQRADELTWTLFNEGREITYEDILRQESATTDSLEANLPPGWMMHRLAATDRVNI